MDSLMTLGLLPSQAMDVLTAQAVHESLTEGTVLDGIFDASDRQEDGEVIMWLNDLEKDDRYRNFPTAIESVGTH
jgi:UDP-glucose:glycoprotein glucosyltransferase